MLFVDEIFSYEERDFNTEASTLEPRNGFRFAHAAKQLMKEQPDTMMSPMFKHIANTMQSNNAHKGNAHAAALWANTRTKIHAKHPDYQQMRINNKIAAMNNPHANALHNAVKNHQHPRDIVSDMEEREWEIDELD